MRHRAWMWILTAAAVAVTFVPNLAEAQRRPASGGGRPITGPVVGRAVPRPSVVAPGRPGYPSHPVYPGRPGYGYPGYYRPYPYYGPYIYPSFHYGFGIWPRYHSPRTTRESGQVRAQKLYVYPAAGQSEARLAEDRYQCHVWATDATGFDPTLGAGTADEAESYGRAFTACMEGRSYVVK